MINHTFTLIQFPPLWTFDKVGLVCEHVIKWGYERDIEQFRRTLRSLYD